MLTKNVLQFRLNGERVRPLFLAKDDMPPEFVECVRDVETYIEGAVGRKKHEVISDIQNRVSTLQKTGAGLAKIATDLLETNAAEKDAEDFRWQVFSFVEARRAEFSNLDDFHSAVDSQFGPTWREKLYADLEPRLPIVKTKPMRTSIVDRYNVAQVQGLLMVSEELTFTVSGVSITELRALIRAAKFFQVLLEINKWDGEKCTFSVAGPLSIFQQQQAYGLKLASFFPVLLHFPRWQLESRVLIKGRRRTLKLDHRTGLRSHYRPLKGYVPAEIAQLEKLIVQKLPSWIKLDCPEPVVVADEELIIPDISLQNVDGNKVHVEFFHRWHRNQLSKRLDFLRKRTNFRFVLVVPKDLCKQLDLKVDELDSQVVNVKIVEFVKTPSAKKVADAVNLATAFN